MEIHPAIAKASQRTVTVRMPVAARSASSPADRHAARATEMSRLLQRIMDRTPVGTPRHFGIND